MCNEVNDVFGGSKMLVIDMLLAEEIYHEVCVC